ncbi:MAG TPA: hypothetical protein GXZ90_04590 [Clostridiales bacterium]|nr:hypothetical protein [Clostridiales bacterium]
MSKIKLNSHQLKANKLILEVISDMIGGYENQMTDSEEGSEDWLTADEFLKTERNQMIELLYEIIITEAQYKGNDKHINFAGIKFIKTNISNKLTEWGY